MIFSLSNIIYVYLCSSVVASSGYFPRFSLSLNGIWKFCTVDYKFGFEEIRSLGDFTDVSDEIDMPVPSSFNDITTDPELRDYIGWVMYQRNVSLPSVAKSKDVTTTIHFGSVEHRIILFIDDQPVDIHEFGHIPFEFDISEFVRNSFPSGNILITVAVNNTLNLNTIPQASTTHHEDEDHFKYTSYTHDFDYFDYAGLNGDVRLDFKPFTHIVDMVIRNVTLIKESTAEIRWSATVANVDNITECTYNIHDPSGVLVFSGSNKPCHSNQFTQSVNITQPRFWWPRSTFEGTSPGEMYSLEIILKSHSSIIDRLSKTFGIRYVETKDMGIQLNGKTVYLKGFGMHQDAEIRGRGYDAVQLVRDMNLLKWTGANAIRTSHYPYSEEFLDMADRHGIMVILEAPACSLSNFNDELLMNHKQILTEMWNIFKNHPSVIMWSLANEPQSNDGNSTAYFKNLVNHMKSLDTTRPVTFVTSQQIQNEKAIQYVDVICVNRYQGWYSLGGRLDLIEHHVVKEMKDWHLKYGKPVILTEYGGEALSGFHALPSTMWTENYQIELLHEHFKAFDSLRENRISSGEMLWNFADFKVPQEYFRAELCTKGIFTRNRQPKGGAYTIKKRYENLLLSNSELPAFRNSTVPSLIQL